MDFRPQLATANRFLEIQPSVQMLASALVRRDGVVGVAATGSYARGFIDLYSDVDLLVFGRKPGLDDLAWDFVEGMVKKGILKELPAFAQRGTVDVNDARVWSFVKFQASPNKTVRELRVPELATLPIEVELLDLGTVRPEGPCWHWLTEYRWMLGHAPMLEDDASGTVGALLREAARYDAEEQEGDLEERRERAGVLLAAAETFVGRGDFSSAQRLLGQAMESVVDGVYARAGLVVPYVKWKYHFLRQLPGLPPDAEARLSAAFADVDLHGLEPEAAARRLRARIEGCRALKRELLPRAPGTPG